MEIAICKDHEPVRIPLRIYQPLLPKIMLTEYELTSEDYLYIINNTYCTTIVFLQEGMDRMPRIYQ